MIHLGHGVGGRQKTQENNIYTVRNDTAADVVYAHELASYLSINDYEESLMNQMLAAAIDSISNKYKIAIGQAEYTYYADYWPLSRNVYVGLSRIKGQKQPFILLPFAPITEIISAKTDGEDFDFVLRNNRLYGCAWNMIEIKYTAGYTAENIPASLKNAILKLAAYEYEHRGACAEANAMQASGAANDIKALGVITL